MQYQKTMAPSISGMNLGMTPRKHRVSQMAVIVFASAGLFSQIALAAPEQSAPLSIRGDTPVADSIDPDPIAKYPVRGDALPRSFVHQPPLIPHKYDYTVDQTRNGCITCHKPRLTENQPRSSATPIHASHYRADGQIDDGYYFCRQCHVAQQSADKSND